MSLNIQTSTGLLEIGGKVTKEKVISALGYEPADKAHTEDKTVHVTSAEKEAWNNKSDVKHYEDLEGAPSIAENDSGNMVIADESGNIIMQVDADGLSTTNVNTKTIKLDGEDLGERLDELESKTSNIVDDESGKVEFADEDGNVIARINANGFETTTVTAKNIIANGVDITTYVDTQVANLVDSSPETLDTLNELAAALGDDPNFATTVATQIGLKADQTSLDTHESNKIIHITTDERATWNAKSNFSGDYNELTNAPNITEDSSGSVVYSDEQGNIIVKVDANGLETTTVTAQSVVVNGVDVETALDGKATSEHTHSQYLEASDIANKTDKSYVDAEIAKKADKTHTHDQYLEASDIANKADKSELHNHSNKTELDKIVDGKVEYWDAKSDFDGSYNSLTDAPNIYEDNSNNLVIADQNGNIIFRSDVNGFETTTLTAQTVVVNGTNIKDALDGKAASSHTHDDRYYTESEIDSKLSGKANSSHGNHVPATQTANNAVFLRNDNSWQTVTPANIGAATSGHTHSVATTSAAGFAPALAGGTTKFLRADGTWVAPPDTNTHRTTGITAGASSTNTNSSATDPYIKIRDDSSFREQIRLKGSGATSVSSDASGNITISSTDTDTKVKQMKSATNGNFPLLLAPTDVADTDYRYSYYASGIYANPSLKKIYADVNGNASSADKINTDAGSATQPVYFSGGKPVATTYSLGASVPSGAKFTDTTYSAGTGISLSGTTFSNSGVRSISTGTANGTISVNTNGSSANVAVKGLGSAAYTDSTDYAAASHKHDYLPLSGGTVTGHIELENSLNVSEGAYFTNSDTSDDANAIYADGNVTVEGNLEVFAGNIYLDNGGAGIYFWEGDTDLGIEYTNGIYLSSNANLHVGQNTIGSNKAHSGNTYINAVNGDVYLKNSNSSIRWFAYSGSGYKNIFRCETNSAAALGSDSCRWYKLYAASACSTSSDEREKSDIAYISDYPVTYSRTGSDGNIFEQFFDRLIPATYTLNVETTDDLHIGFIAQDVEKAAIDLGLPAEELGFIQHSFWKDEETGEDVDRYALCYEEFIALNTYMIQKQKAQINEQQAQINSLEERIAQLEALITNNN